MAKRSNAAVAMSDGEPVYYGTIACQAQKQSGVMCANGAYYYAGESDRYLYCDPAVAFGHESVLYTLLTQEAPYPWDLYRERHAALYENVAHVETTPLHQ